jgi:hypothetical protein
LKWIRDVRDEPEEPTDWSAVYHRYRVTFVWLLFGGLQSAATMVWQMGVMLLLIGLPVTLAVDWCRHWRKTRSTVARLVPESERLNFPL